MSIQFVPPHVAETKIRRKFLISNFRHVLNVVCFLPGNSLASEFENSDAGELHRRKHTKRKFAKLSLSYSCRDHWQCRPLVWNMPANCKGVTEHTVDLYEVCLFVPW